jgi:hypothetical protein
VGGTIIYKIVKDDRVLINLLKDYLVFIIISGFTLDSGTDIIIRKGLAYYIYNVKVLMLKLNIIVVIILKY